MIHSDRIAHALAYAAKHGASRARKGGGTSWPTRPSNVAVLLSRYGCDENTIVAGVLAAMLNDMAPERRAEFETRMTPKFGAIVMEIVRPAIQPVLDARGKERTWEACRMEYLSILSNAEVRVLEVCAADAIYACGGILTDLRRLGVEYLGDYAPGGAPAVVRWYQDIVVTFERHPRGPRAAILHDLRDLTTRLADGVAQAG